MATTRFSTIIGSAQVVLNAGPVTPTVTWTNQSGGTVDSSGLSFYRVGRQLIINGIVTFTGTFSGASQLAMNLAGLTIKSAQNSSIRAEITTTNLANTYEAYGSAGTIIFYTENTGSASAPINGADIGSVTSGKIKNFQFKGAVFEVTNWAADEYLAQGAGLATSVKPGLVTNSIPPTNLVSTDLTSQTNCTIDPGDVLACKFAMTNGKVDFYFNLATVTVGTAVGIQFTLPTSVPRPLTTFYTTYTYYDNSGSNLQIGMMSVDTSGTVALFKAAGAAWTASTNGTYLRGEIFWFTT